MLDGRQHVLHQAMRSKMARHLPARMPTHAVGHCKESDWREPSTKRASAVLHKHRVLIGLLPACDANIPADSDIFRRINQTRQILLNP